MSAALCALLSPDRRARREAVLEIALWAPEARFALRQALLCDPDAEVRARCAARLGRCEDDDGPDLAIFLRDAAGDPAPSVREAALRALGRRRDRGAAALLRRGARQEPVWWVRRAAVLALGAALGVEAVPDLLAVLRDPFWRVRHAAVQALGVLGEGRPGLQRQVLAGDPGPAHAAAALRYLRARWAGQDADADPIVPPAAGPLPWNEDPAVTTARLLRTPPGACDPLALVPLLGDSHGPLRTLAARRLAASADERALVAALRWLEQPLLPYGAATVTALLDGLGGPARALAGRVLGEEGFAPGAVAWACRWVALAGDEAGYPLVQARCAAPEPVVRRAAVAALVHAGQLGGDALVAVLLDEDEEVRVLAAPALLRLSAGRAREVLAGLAVADPGQPVPVRCALVEAARQAGEGRRLRAALDDRHPLVRSRAVAALHALCLLGAAERAAYAADADPWVRAAALGPAEAPAALEHDPDPLVRRAALRLLLPAARRLLPGEHARLGLVAAAAPDPWVRARGCQLLDVTTPAGLRAALRLSRDRWPMVRAAVAEVLAAYPDLDGALYGLLQGSAGDEERAAAYAWLLREWDDAARALLARAVADPGEPALVQAQLRAMAVAAGLSHGVRPATIKSPPWQGGQPAAGRREGRPAGGADPARPLGRTGLVVAPLGISGANDPPPRALRLARDAGANLFFWEPGYAALTRFLRGQKDDGLVVVAGSFHGHAAGIEADVRRALRLLRRDRLDVFLLFWTRSPERLSPEAWSCLQRLKQAGAIRAAGFSTHHRGLALAAITGAHPWDVIMTRHSAAHPGAEAALLPAAQAAGMGVLTFSALCYGRLLRAPSGVAPTAADCYRYSLSQPGVGACLSAPRSTREMAHNLQVLARPTLSAEALAALRAHGERVHAEDRRFDALVRRQAVAGPEGPGADPDPLQALLDMDEEPAARDASDLPHAPGWAKMKRLPGSRPS